MIGRLIVDYVLTVSICVEAHTRTVEHVEIGLLSAARSFRVARLAAAVAGEVDE
jgi:hypothetical protein